MKKTTLITTLALVVIVALALSTATFAWYSTGNAVATADTISVTAQMPGDGNLLIKNSQPGSQFGTTAAMKGLQANMSPAALVAATTDNIVDANFTTATIAGASGGQVFDSDGTTATVWTDSFSLQNDSTNMTINAQITGLPANAFWMVVVSDGTNNVVIGCNGKYATVAPATNGVVADYNGAMLTLPAAGTITIGASAAIQNTTGNIYIWYDGVGLTAASYNASSGATGISVSFQAA